jgi:hypothetical protein
MVTLEEARKLQHDMSIPYQARALAAGLVSAYAELAKNKELIAQAEKEIESLEREFSIALLLPLED